MMPRKPSDATQTRTLKAELARTKSLLEASQREVTRLSDTVKRMAADLHSIKCERAKWERRFDALLAAKGGE